MNWDVWTACCVVRVKGFTREVGGLPTLKTLKNRNSNNNRKMDLSYKSHACVV